MKKPFLILIIMCCSTHFLMSQSLKKMPQNGLYVAADSSLYDVRVSLLQNDCLIKYNHYRGSKLVELAYLNESRDTLYSFSYHSNGKIAIMEQFYIKKDSMICVLDISEGTYFSYLRNRKKYNEKCELIENAIYDIKLKKSMDEYQSKLVLMENYKKNKVVYRSRFIYDEKLNYRELVEIE